MGCRLVPIPHAHSVAVIEVRRGNRQHRRRYGKSDPTDAISAARSVQSGEEHGVAKSTAPSSPTSPAPNDQPPQQPPIAA